MQTWHQVVGWVVLTTLLVGGLHARARVRSGRGFEGGPYRFAVVLVDVQVLLGGWLFVDRRLWEQQGLLDVWAHPVLGVLGLVVAHVGMRRARDERWAASAYSIASRTLLVTLLLLGLATWVAATR